MEDKERTGLRVAYICDGGPKLGLGHINRGRALLQATPGYLVVGGGKAQLTQQLQGVEWVPWSSQATPFAPDAVPDALVVVDNYEIPERWIAALAQHTTVVVVDDWRRPNTAAHWVVNPNVGARSNFYSGPPLSRRLCGSRYALIRPGLSTCTPLSPDVGRVLVTLGGGDPSLPVPVVVEAIVSHARGLLRRIDVVLGPVSSGELPKIDSSARDLVVIHRGAANFAELCASAEIVVCPASTTSHEMAYLGVAFIPVVTVGNQVRTGMGWQEAGMGSYLTSDDPRVPDRIGEEVSRLLGDRPSRLTRVSRGRRIVDGNGAHRIIQSLGVS